MSDTILHVTISGRVQGVGYRAWVEHEARARGLDGWVRNRRDGSVEALFAGSADVVADMVASCRRGPISARVNAVAQQSAGADALALRHSGEKFSVLSTI
jgi:acylphosphatase